MRVLKYEAANEGGLFCFQPIERGMKVCFYSLHILHLKSLELLDYIQLSVSIICPEVGLAALQWPAPLQSLAVMSFNRKQALLRSQPPAAIRKLTLVLTPAGRTVTWLNNLNVDITVLCKWSQCARSGPRFATSSALPRLAAGCQIEHHLFGMQGLEDADALLSRYKRRSRDDHYCEFPRTMQVRLLIFDFAQMAAQATAHGQLVPAVQRRVL